VQGTTRVKSYESSQKKSCGKREKTNEPKDSKETVEAPSRKKKTNEERTAGGFSGDPPEKKTNTIPRDSLRSGDGTRENRDPNGLGGNMGGKGKESAKKRCSNLCDTKGQTESQ